MCPSTVCLCQAPWGFWQQYPLPLPSTLGLPLTLCCTNVWVIGITSLEHPWQGGYKVGETVWPQSGSRGVPDGLSYFLLGSLDQAQAFIQCW